MSKEKLKEDKPKINIVGLLVLMAVTLFSAYVIIGSKLASDSLKSSIEANKSEQTEKDKKMEENSSYKRLKEYGERLKVAKGVDEMKDSSPVWSQFVTDLARNYPKFVFQKGMTYDVVNQSVAVSIIGPTRESLVRTMAFLNDSDGLSAVNFETITEEKVTFLGEKLQRPGYSTIATLKINQDWLKSQYEFAREVKESANSDTGVTEQDEEPASGSGISTSTN